MQKIGILIETQKGQIKKTNLGVITAARGDGRELYAFLLEILPEDQKDLLQAYGVDNIVEIQSADAPIDYNPVSWSQATIQAMVHFGIDALLGVGGTPEGVLAACAIRAMGGELQGKLFIRNDEERQLGLEMGYDLDKVITMDDLVSSNDVFFAATGITDGELLGGVRYTGQGGETQSLSIRGKTGTVRWINAKHNFEKLNIMSEIEY